MFSAFDRKNNNYGCNDNYDGDDGKFNDNDDKNYQQIYKYFYF